LAFRRITFNVTEQEAGTRLDRLLVVHAGIGRKRARELFAAGSVRVGARRPSAGEPARAGDEVQCELEADVPEPDASLPLAVRFEHPALVIVEKPAGQPSAPLAAGERGTLCNALLAHYPEMAGVGYRPREPGLLHRLDTQTSGLLLCARSPSAFTTLKDALRSGALHKRYLALCEDRGLADSGAIERPIGPDPRRPERVLVHDARPSEGYARGALTRFRVLARQAGLLLLELTAPHAVRHQIRAHLASAGHPILGDVIYGSGKHPALGDRHALHASYIAWAGDGTLPSFELDSELPAELGRLLT
jgi:23S rRNA pseudouridine1911/1915/1917 synthase